MYKHIIHDLWDLCLVLSNHSEIWLAAQQHFAEQPVKVQSNPIIKILKFTLSFFMGSYDLMFYSGVIQAPESYISVQ